MGDKESKFSKISESIAIRGVAASVQAMSFPTKENLQDLLIEAGIGLMSPQKEKLMIGVMLTMYQQGARDSRHPIQAKGRTEVIALAREYLTEASLL